MAKKIFVLRTNSLVSKEGSTLCFDSDNEVVIPFPVLDELEKLTQEFSAKGKNARKVLEYISSFKISELMSPHGVIQSNGSRLRLVKEDSNILIPLDGLKPFDLKCLQIVKKLASENPKTSVILVTKNAALRIKANSIGIKAQNFKDDLFPTLEEQYTGRIECQTSDEKLNSFFKTGEMKLEAIYKYKNIEWYPNMFLVITSPSGGSAVARFDGKKIVKLNHISCHPYGITPKNVGQKMMLEALMESPETAPIVIIKGGAGTGKTYQSLASALQQTSETPQVYSQILVSSPVQTVGQERIGFLPGDIEEKFNPHLGGITDNIRLLLKGGNKDDKTPMRYQENGDYFFERGIMQVQPIGFLRGRTIVNTFFIIDETQNIDPEDIKSIVSRSGQGCKMVFLGDPTQIDNPALNERFNGLVYLTEKMKNSNLAWQITLKDEESVRSEVARLAARIL